jgi:predicted ATPase
MRHYCGRKYVALIEGFRIKNYRVLRDVTLGRLRTGQNQPEALTPLVAVIGKNGTGKSTLFDAFGFLADALRVGVEEACDLKQRGGFDRLVSAGTSEPVEFELYYRESGEARPISYELKIGKEKKGRPYVLSERLSGTRPRAKRGRLYDYLRVENGTGSAWRGEQPGVNEQDRVEVNLADPRHLGIATFGALKEHPPIVRFREFLSGWYLSYFTPDAARSLPMAGPQKHLNVHGDNLGNVVQFMEREHPERFKAILDRIAAKIPGIDKIDTSKTDDGRLLLRFNDKGFKDPFFAQQMSDGTLKLFAYLLLLEDPEPPPFVCIEEPENGLYHRLLDTLAEEFRKHATGRRGAAQVFVTTHQPYFVDALRPEETWILDKESDGFSGIRRASDDRIVKAMVQESLPLGGLWYSEYLDKK